MSYETDIIQTGSRVKGTMVDWFDSPNRVDWSGVVGWIRYTTNYPGNGQTEHFGIILDEPRVVAGADRDEMIVKVSTDQKDSRVTIELA